METGLNHRAHSAGKWHYRLAMHVKSLQLYATTSLLSSQQLENTKILLHVMGPTVGARYPNASLAGTV